MQQQFEELINSFIDTNVGIADHFLSTALSSSLQQNIQQLQDDKQMKYAGIGNETVADATQQMRGDKISWLDKKNNNINEQEFLEKVEDFIDHLNKTCYTGINDYEFHYAIYEEGCAYKRHKDQFKTDNKRKYSLICYLNNDWKVADGGQLMIYQNDTAQSILPTAQKAVFFKSAEMEHEVLLAHKSRMSVTGWLKQR
ncbi:2OG-Fe(II) oxygenase [Ferruginibacter sp.]|uniref:2OG-Fe(II) oxygenase n=1 Tax=Ferruginibacter sp. TaxID=1940288 RepID=UPI00265B338D|nr:2OG-Fe(II) oxygenase [Ferruginibacter sp.]